MGLFAPEKRDKINKALKEFEEINVEGRLSARHLVNIRQVLSSINQKINDGTLSGREPEIRKILNLLKNVEKEEEAVNSAMQKIENLSVSLHRKKAA